MTISLQINADVAQITLDDGRANAINPPWIDQFLETFTEAENNAKAIVIAGRDGIFSGGFDLKWMPTATAEEMARLLDGGGEIITRVYGSERPVVAACTGHAIAMGLFVLLSCDTRIGAAGEFGFGANETRNGMNLPVFASVIVQERLDPSRLTEVLVQSRMFGPDDALDLGALDKVVAPEAVLDTALATAQELAQLPGSAYGFNKLAIRRPAIERIKATTAGY